MKISNRLPIVWVSYMGPGGRHIKRFEDAHEARRFYARMYRAGRDPRVHNSEKIARANG